MPPYYGESPMKRYGEMVIPILLIILVAVIVGAKVFNICPPVIGDLLCDSGPVIQTLIITQDQTAAEQFAQDITTVTRVRPQIETNIQHIKEGFITSNEYDLVVLYGDSTALTDEARSELTEYVEGGGNLVIVRGAGLKQIESTGDISEFVFNWNVGDMARIIKFSPDCPTVGDCDDVGLITVTPEEMYEVSLTPTDWDHPIISRIGMEAVRDIDLTAYPEFTGITRVVDEENKKILYIDWKDAAGNTDQAAAIIVYDAGLGGGRVTYLAFNPMELNDESMFMEIVNYATGQT